MPGEFLRDVVVTRTDRRSQRRWSILPVSIAAHVAGAVAVFIMPLAAEIEPPTPAPLSLRLPIIAARPLPAAPSVPRAAATPTPSPAAAPTVIPDTIAAERDEPRGPVGDPGAIGAPGVIGGVDRSIGGVIEPAVVELPPPPPPRVTKPVPVGGLIREPRKIAHVAPVYPAIAVSARVEGAVMLEAVISTSGVVENVRVLKSVPLLDQAAIDAVRGWRYTPTHLNGVPVPVLITITVRFTLQR